MNQPTLWTRSFCVLTVSHFLGALGYASMVLLPLYLTHLGGRRAEVALIMSSAHISGLLTRPLVGWCLDIIGRRRSLMLGGILTAISLAFVYQITSVNEVAFGVRVLFGIGEGFLFTGYFAFAADLIPQARRTEGLALFGVSGLLPLLVNPIADLTGFQGEGLRSFLTAMSGFILLSAVLVYLLPENLEKSSEKASSIDQTVKQSPSNTLSYLLSTRLHPLWWSTIAFAGAVAIFMTFASVVGASRGMSLPTAAWFTYVAGALCARLLGAKVPERLGPERLVAPSLCLYGFALLVSSLIHDALGMLIAGGLAGIAHGYCFPVLTSLIVSAVEEQFRGRALAMFTGLWGGSAVLFAPIGGWMADQWGDEKMFTIFGLCLLMSALYATPLRLKQTAIKHATLQTREGLT